MAYVFIFIVSGVHRITSRYTIWPLFGVIVTIKTSYEACVSIETSYEARVTIETSYEARVSLLLLNNSFFTLCRREFNNRN